MTRTTERAEQQNADLLIAMDERVADLLKAIEQQKMRDDAEVFIATHPRRRASA